ncbi:MAG TPA: hypothetical protein VMK12_22970 [Anaeromyxobacteraceae bacterium]|nr:hypothetical protein [Anaeromyxobacteraceae bacterium]
MPASQRQENAVALGLVAWLSLPGPAGASGSRLASTPKHPPALGDSQGRPCMSDGTTDEARLARWLFRYRLVPEVWSLPEVLGRSRCPDQ